MPSLTIAIVGASLGGLLLARILQMHGTVASVYERDFTADVRSQGGLLDMHVESGQRALRLAGLHDAFLRLAQPQGEALRVLDKAGTVFISHEAEDGRADGRPEIGRAVLRDLLIASLDPGRIIWGRKVTGISSGRDTGRELIFDDGSRATADLVVGADGAWSNVRPLLSASRPNYCGISYVELHLSDIGGRHPDLAALVGPGLFFALSDNKALIAHGGRHIHLGASLRVPQDWTMRGGVDWLNAAAAREALLGEFADWSPQLRKLIAYCDDMIVLRLIYALPAGHSWPRIPGVTLLGDAAHVMSPYAGEGANLAMLDAADLALAIVEHGDNIEAALTQYEAGMFPRAKQAAEASAQGLDMCFSTDSPRMLVDFFGSMASP